MGESVSTRCKNCGDSQDFFTGVGFMYSSLSEVTSLTTGNTRKKLQNIVANHTVTDADYEHRVLACPRCDTLHDRFHVRVSYDDGEEFETQFICGKCRAGLVELDKPVNEYSCFKCGARSLVEVPGICWD